MRVGLAYGRGEMVIEVPDTASVIEPKWTPALPDAAAAVRSALRRPLVGRSLRVLAENRKTVGISICDVTRPFPARVVLPVMLEELDVDPARVTLFIATGTHRACTPSEIDEMLGDAIPRGVRIVQHDAFDRNRHVALGMVPGSTVPALVEAEFMVQDLKITTGFIEPHFFAGFSGGPKMVYQVWPASKRCLNFIRPLESVIPALPGA